MEYSLLVSVTRDAELPFSYKQRISATAFPLGCLYLPRIYLLFIYFVAENKFVACKLSSAKGARENLKECSPGKRSMFPPKSFKCEIQWLFNQEAGQSVLQLRSKGKKISLFHPQMLLPLVVRLRMGIKSFF